MALALRLFLLLLLAVALPARAAQAAPLRARGSDLDHDLDDLEGLLNDTLNVLEKAGAEPAGEGGVASQPMTRTEPLGDGEVMEGEAVQKAQFPEGSSGSLAASAAGREAMPGTVPGDEVAGKASPLDWLNKVLKPLEPPADVSAERIFPAPLLIPTRQPGSHRRGPLRGKNKAAGHKNHHKPNILKHIVTELHKGNGMDREALWKAAFPSGRAAMPGTVTGAEPVGEGDLASQPTFRIKPLGDGQVRHQKAGRKEVFPQGSSGRLAAPAAGRKAMPDTGTSTGGAASPTAPVPDSQKGIGKTFCEGTGCWLGLMSGLLGLEFIMILCCVRIWTYWKSKGSTSGQELKDGGCTSPPEILNSYPSNNKGLGSPLKNPEKRTPEQPSTRKPLMPV